MRPWLDVLAGVWDLPRERPTPWPVGGTAGAPAGEGRRPVGGRGGAWTRRARVRAVRGGSETDQTRTRTGTTGPGRGQRALNGGGRGGVRHVTDSSVRISPVARDWRLASSLRGVGRVGPSGCGHVILFPPVGGSSRQSAASRAGGADTVPRGAWTAGGTQGRGRGTQVASQGGDRDPSAGQSGRTFLPGARRGTVC